MKIYSDKPLTSLVFLMFLSAFYPAVFFSSNNWYIFSRTQLFVLMVGAPIICAFILLVTVYTTLFITKLVIRLFKGNASSDMLNQLVNPIFAVFSILLMNFLLRNALKSLPLPRTVLILVIVTIIILIFCAVYKNVLKGLKALNAFLFMLILVALIGYFYNVFSILSAYAGEEWSYKNKRINTSIEFSKKPNVYLIISESYPNREALKEVFKFDNISFYQELESNGFNLYHDYYSNYNYTLSSLPSLFAMEHHFYSINLGTFDAIGGRRMLELKAHNPVIQVFKNNGYKIQYIHSNSSLLPKGADVDYCFPSSTAWLALEVFLTNQDTTRRFFQSKDSDYLKLLDTRISRTVSEGRPYFNFYYFTRPGHSPSRWSADTWADRNKTLEKFRQNYYKDVQKANNLLMDMVKMILDKDDSSLIIIMGDHGTWGYRYGRNGNNKLIPNRLFTLDRFGVLSAIRLPKGQNQRFDNNLKTHINIFRYVFAYLSGNDNILTARASDNSYEDAETLVIKDGTIDSTSSGYAKIVANHANKIMSQKNGNADQITVLIEMGLILGKHNHLKEAYHYFQKAIEFSKGKKKLRRQASSAHSGLGQIYYLGGEYELALSHFKEAYVQYDQNWQVCYNLDLTLKALKRFKEAEFYFNIYKKNSSKYK